MARKNYSDEFRRQAVDLYESASSASAPADETPEQQSARLEAKVADLAASEKKLTTEREILRSAAKYFGFSSPFRG
jgi:transposase